MALAAGTRLGAYEIVGLIGAGGMGEVYRARDTRLDRPVAIKVLPDAFRADAERAARFEREAKLLATLNHPNIAGIYGLEDSRGEQCIVMELVDGETLADRIARGPIPVAEALEIAKQIADALEAAHEKGIIHRDLKPANVKLTPDDQVKVLDFGLAKAFGLDAAHVSPDVLTNSPTLTSPIAATGVGVLLGTPAYMAPEQAKGRAVDKRGDVWAFGCVLYEMLTGRRAFAGEDVPETIGAVIHKEPDWTALPEGTPSAIRALLRRCLQKDRRQRIPDVGVARIEIQDVIAGGPADVAPPRAASRYGERLAWAVAAVCFVALVALSMALASRGPSRATISPDILRFPLVPPPDVSLVVGAPGATPIRPAVSPDGRRVAFIGVRDGISLLWIRSLGQYDAQPLIGTEGALDPFWSPDSRMVGFYANGRLNSVDAAGGSIQPICDALPVRGATWSQTGVILFGSDTTGLLKVAERGGVPSPATTIDTGSNEVNHAAPWFLPDGQHFIYRAGNTNWVGTLNGNERTQLPPSDSSVVYGGPGYLLFLRQAALMAQPFDVVTMRVTGEAFPVGEQVLAVGARAAFSVSQNGVLVYRAATTIIPTQLAWFDRSGARLGVAAPPSLYRNPVLSADGMRIAVERTDPSSQTQDIYTIDAMSGLETRLTFDTHDDVLPVWSPDGTRITFGSNRDGLFSLYEKPSNGERPERRLYGSHRDHVPYSWSADDFIVFRTWSGTGVRSIGILSISDLKPQLYEEPKIQQTSPELALNGRWILFGRGVPGSADLFVQSFPKPTGVWQISTGGALYGRWSKNSRELFYYARDSRIMAVPFTDEPTFQPRPATGLFKVQMSLPAMSGTSNFRQQFDVTPDGKRFLINLAPETAPAETPQLRVVLNWQEELKRRVPTR